MPRITNWDALTQLVNIVEDHMPRQICPECNLPRMNGQSYTCDQCWSSISKRRRDEYQEGKRGTSKKYAEVVSEMGDSDFMLVADSICKARHRLKYGAEIEFFRVFVNELIGDFSRTYVTFDNTMFNARCGGPFDHTDDDERQRQRGYEPDSMTPPPRRRPAHPPTPAVPSVFAAYDWNPAPVAVDPALGIPVETAQTLRPGGMLRVRLRPPYPELETAPEIPASVLEDTDNIDEPRY